MKIYIVRHGQTPSNLAGVYNFIEEDLNENGIEQAMALKERIKIRYSNWRNYWKNKLI